MRLPIPVALLMLGACHSPETRGQINRMEAGGTLDEDGARRSAKASAAAASTAKPVVIDQDTGLVDLHAAWPGEAAAIPALDARFRAEADKALAEMMPAAKADKELRAKDGFDFPGYSSKVDYKVAGASSRLLSLDAAFDAYTGGAHGNHGTIAVLWDKAIDKDIGFAGLFADPNVAFATIAKAWCAGLDAERAKRRGDEYRVDDRNNPFSDCPKLDEISVIPTDKNGDGRFEALRVVADPYVAGPYVEGDYEVWIDVDPTLVAAFKPAYRQSFAA